MVERIKWTMLHYNLSAAQFADQIGVQRSAVSHVLSGRNKPSLDFLIKIKKKFQDINFEWLALGSGNQLLDGQITSPESSAHDITEPLAGMEEIDSQPELNFISAKTGLESKRPDVALKHESLDSKEDISDQRKRRLIRVVLLYSDGHFEAYDTGK